MENNDRSWKFLSLPFFRFVFLSVLGIFMFMVPIPVNGRTDLVIGVLRGWIRDLVPAANRSTVVFAILVIAALITVINFLFKPGVIRNNPLLSNIFSVDKGWGTCRFLGGVFAVIAYFRIGPMFLWHDDTGGMILSYVLVALIPWFIITGLLIPFLTSYGAMEFFGTLLRPFWRRAFSLPGRSSVDCLASILMSATVSVLVTDKQYEDGYYSKREAYIIVACFSIASYPGVVFTIDLIGMNEHFAIFYLSLLFITLFSALLMPRIWPLNRINNTYYTGESRLDEDFSKDVNLLSYAVSSGINAATKNARLSVYSSGAGKTLAGLIFNTVPAVMTIGVVGMALTTFTPIFDWISYPFFLLLELFRIPYAAGVAPTMLIGFAYSDLPSFMVAGQNITNPLTLFVVWVVAYSQIIFMSGVGAVLMASKMQVSFKYCAIIFIIRTIISFPLAILLGHFFFG